MLHKIRCNLMEDVNELRDAFSGVVQMDETYIGGKPKGKIWQNQGRSLKQKVPVVGLLTEEKVACFRYRECKCEHITRHYLRIGSPWFYRCN